MKDLNLRMFKKIIITKVIKNKANLNNNYKNITLIYNINKTLILINKSKK